MASSARTLAVRTFKHALWQVMRHPVGLKVTQLVSEERDVFLANQANERHRARLEEKIGRTVLRGPFAGLQYPELASIGSTLFPKLIGSYEAELHPVLEWVATRPYATVIDIGAAEGFYAVGLARRLPAARIVAFEIDPRGQTLLRALADANDVGSRVDVRGACDASALARLLAGAPAHGPVLIVSDCEGAEYDLLSLPEVPGLAHCDILLELHRVRGFLPRRHWADQLQATHDVRFVDPVDRDPIAFPELETIPLEDRMRVLFERIDVDGWLLAVART